MSKAEAIMQLEEMPEDKFQAFFKGLPLRVQLCVQGGLVDWRECLANWYIKERGETMLIKNDQGHYQTVCEICGDKTDYYRTLCAKCELTEIRKTTQQSMKDRRLKSTHPCMTCELMIAHTERGKP